MQHSVHCCHSALLCPCSCSLALLMLGATVDDSKNVKGLTCMHLSWSCGLQVRWTLRLVCLSTLASRGTSALIK